MFELLKIEYLYLHYKLYNCFVSNTFIRNICQNSSLNEGKACRYLYLFENVVKFHPKRKKSWTIQ